MVRFILQTDRRKNVKQNKRKWKRLNSRSHGRDWATKQKLQRGGTSELVVLIGRRHQYHVNHEIEKKKRPEARVITIEAGIDTQFSEAWLAPQLLFVLK